MDEWNGANGFFRYGNLVFRTYFIKNRGDEQRGTPNYPDVTPLSRQEVWRLVAAMLNNGVNYPAHAWRRLVGPDAEFGERPNNFAGRRDAFLPASSRLLVLIKDQIFCA